MTREGTAKSLGDLTSDQISVDAEGRVVIEDPELAELVKSVLLAGGTPPTNGNCSGCNATSGCTTNGATHCGALPQ